MNLNKIIPLWILSVSFLISTTARSQQEIYFDNFKSNNSRHLISADTIPNFLTVTDQIYRGGRPLTGDLLALKNNKGILTVINLENKEPYFQEEKKTAFDLNLKYFSFPMDGSVRPNDQQIEQVLSILKNSSNFPIFLHCHHGQDRTGLIIGLYRVKVQGWSAKDAYNEMLQNGFHSTLKELDQYFWDKAGNK